MEQDIQHCLALKNMMLFTTELKISIKYVFSHYYEKIKVDSHDS